MGGIIFDIQCILSVHLIPYVTSRAHLVADKNLHMRPLSNILTRRLQWGPQCYVYKCNIIGIAV